MTKCKELVGCLVDVKQPLVFIAKIIVGLYVSDQFMQIFRAHCQANL